MCFPRPLLCSSCSGGTWQSGSVARGNRCVISMGSQGGELCCKHWLAVQVARSGAQSLKWQLVDHRSKGQGTYLYSSEVMWSADLVLRSNVSPQVVFVANPLLKNRLLNRTCMSCKWTTAQRIESVFHSKAVRYGNRNDHLKARRWARRLEM